MSNAPPWLHGRINKEEAEAKLNKGGISSGKFLVRKHKEVGKYVLSIGFKGKPTHHICAKTEEGVYGVNGKTYGGTAKNIASLIKYLQGGPQGWPVKFGDYVSVDGATSSSSLPKSPVKSKATAERMTASGGGGGVGGKSNTPGWMHGVITKEVAENLLGSEPNPHKSGRFLIRKRAQKGTYVMSICFKGKPTHHMISKDEQGVMTINKKSFSPEAKKLTVLLSVLSKKPAGWPVAIVEFVDGNGKVFPYKDEGETTDTTSSPTKKPTAAPTSTTTTPATKGGKATSSTFIHPPLAKAKAEELLLQAYNGEKKEGTFLFRMKPKSEKMQYVLSVIFKGNATHHLVSRTKVGEDWTVHKTQCEGIVKLKQLAEHLKTKKKWWPVPLLYPVMKEGGAKPKPTKDDTDTSTSTTTTTTTKENTTKNKENKEEEKTSNEDGDKEPDAEEKPPVPDDVNKPVREFVGGSMVDVTIMRESTNSAWGFGIGMEWLGVGHGHGNVVSNIVVGSPAEGALQIHDIIVQIDGHLVESSDLAEVKESMIDTEKVVKLMLYRKRVPRTNTTAPDLEPIIPPQQTKSEKVKSWWATSVVAKVKKSESVDEKPKVLTPKKKDLECNSMWDPVYSVREKQAREKLMRKASTNQHRQSADDNIAMNFMMADDTLV